jgi:CubicO group peptidase (beta-lactamase class C family)
MKLETGVDADREITIRDAITHTSGLAGDQVFAGSLAAAVDQLARRPLAFQPGTKWQYSPGLNVAGRVVEVVSGQALEDFLQQRIFEPLGMTNTTFRPNEKQQRRIATIYRPREDKRSLVAADNFITNFANVKGPNPSGGLVASARDLFRFYQMVLNKGQLRKRRVLSPQAVEQMTSPQTGDLTTGFTPGNCWGLGWCIVRKPQGVTGMLSPGTYGHGGAFGTQGWVDPVTKTIYVLMIQRTDFGNSDASDIRRTFQQLANEALGLQSS